MWLIKSLSAPLALSALVILAGCASPRPDVAGAQLNAPTPLDQYAMGLRETPDQVGLSVHADGVSAAQREALVAFTSRWRQAGSGPITVQVPNDAPETSGARAYAEAAVSTLGVLGVTYEQVHVTGYAAGPGARPVVLASFSQVTAQVPDCHSVGWENLTATKDNKPYNRFGCALTANLAAQIADPADLRGDTPLAPADNTRRQIVLGKYRDGKVTASDKDNQASGVVSSAVKP